MSTNVEKIILDNADHWWPGSADRLVAIYQACSRDKGRSFRAAVSVNIMLTSCTARGEILASFRDIIPVGTRGAAKERYDAAILALDSLLAEHPAVPRSGSARMSTPKALSWFAFIGQSSGIDKGRTPVPSAVRGKPHAVGPGVTWAGSKPHASDDAALAEARAEHERRGAK